MKILAIEKALIKEAMYYKQVWVSFDSDAFDYAVHLVEKDLLRSIYFTKNGAMLCATEKAKSKFGF